MAVSTPPEHDLAVTAARAAAFLAKNVERALSTVDLTPPQYRFLVLLGSGRVSPAQAAELLAVRPPSVTAIVDGMVARSLVEREEVATDRRRVTISITPEGSQALEEGDRAIAALLDEIAGADAAVQRGEIQMGTKRNGYVKRYYSADLAEFNKQKVFVSFSPSDPSKIWVRSMDDQRLLAVAKLDGNASPYFVPSHIEEKREQRGVARLNRLEMQAEETRLEMHGPERIQVAPVPYELEPETIATVNKVIELKRAKDATPRLDQELRDSQHQLHDDIQERQRRGEATEYECRWLEHYAMTAKGKRYGLYQKDPFCMDDPERLTAVNGE